MNHPRNLPETPKRSTGGIGPRSHTKGHEEGKTLDGGIHGQIGDRRGGKLLHFGFRTFGYPTLSKSPAIPGDDLLSFFETNWPAESFFLGAIELFGPDRINEEHDALLPGCLIVKSGFLCLGSDGGGGMYSYCLNDRKVYLVPRRLLDANVWISYMYIHRLEDR